MARSHTIKRTHSMKVMFALALAVVLQISPGLAQQLQQSPNVRQQESPVAPAPTVRPQVSAPRRIAVPPRGAPPESLHEAPSMSSTIVLHRQPAAGSDPPGFRRVRSVSSLPGMRKRPIARHVAVHGTAFGIPAVVAVGAPYVIDVPGLGWVYVPEDEYPELFASLTSDDPGQVEAAYERLQELASAQ